MHADCEYCIKRDICTRDVPKPCRYKYTEEERIADQASDNCGTILSAMYLPNTYKRRKNKMKATSVQKIDNVKEMHFTIEKSSIDGGTKVIIVADTNDDIFEFHFFGDGCDMFANKWFDLVAEKAYKEDWESEQKKRKKLKKENEKLKKENKDLVKSLRIMADKVKEMEETKDERY